jgi:hypothetical protein
MAFQLNGGIALIVIGVLLILLLLPGVPETVGGLVGRPIRTNKWSGVTKLMFLTFGGLFLILGLQMSSVTTTPQAINPSQQAPTNVPVATTVPLSVTTSPTTTVKVIVSNMDQQTDVTFVITGKNGSPMVSLAVPSLTSQTVSLPPGNYTFAVESKDIFPTLTSASATLSPIPVIPSPIQVQIPVGEPSQVNVIFLRGTLLVRSSLTP